LRNRTGPTVGSMLSAIDASVAFIGSCGALAALPRDETRRGRRVYKKTLKRDLVLVGLGGW